VPPSPADTSSTGPCSRSRSCSRDSTRASSCPASTSTRPAARRCWAAAAASRWPQQTRLSLCHNDTHRHTPRVATHTQTPLVVNTDTQIQETRRHRDPRSRNMDGSATRTWSDTLHEGVHLVAAVAGEARRNGIGPGNTRIRRRDELAGGDVRAARRTGEASGTLTALGLHDQHTGMREQQRQRDV
jgi:hypothetical protein